MAVLLASMVLVTAVGIVGITWQWRRAEATGRELLTFRGHTGSVDGLALAPDGERIASGDWQGWLKVWNAATGAEIFSRRTPPHVPSTLAFSGDGRFLASGSRQDGRVRIWNAQTGDELRTLTGHGTGRVQRVAFSPDSRQFASAGTDGTVKVWDVATWEVRHTLTSHAGWVECVAFSPDGRHLASASWDGTVKIWAVPPSPD